MSVCSRRIGEAEAAKRGDRLLFSDQDIDGEKSVFRVHNRGEILARGASIRNAENRGSLSRNKARPQERHANLGIVQFLDDSGFLLAKPLSFRLMFAPVCYPTKIKVGFRSKQSKKGFGGYVVKKSWLIVLVGIAIMISMVGVAISGTVLDWVSPYAAPSYCEGIIGDPSAPSVCPGLSENRCEHYDFCWWRDTTNQNSLAEYTETEFSGEVLNPYTSRLVKLWVWNGQEGANVIAIQTSSYYLLIGAGASESAADEAWASLAATIPGFDSLTPYAVFYNSSEPQVWGGTEAWGFDNTLPVYAHPLFTSELARQSAAATALDARAAQARGNDLEFGADGFLGAGAEYSYDVYAPAGNALPNTVISDDTSTTIVVDRVPLTFVPTSAHAANYAIWIPGHRILFLGSPYSDHFPNIAPMDRPALDVSSIIADLNTFINLTPNMIVFQHGLPVTGNADARQLLTDQRDALQYLYTETLRRANLGEDVDTIVATIGLPASLANSAAVQQFTTTVEGVVRAIYGQNFGWFNGGAANLAMHGLSQLEQASRLLDIGGASIVKKAAERALEEHTYEGAKWAAYLAHALVLADPSNDTTILYTNALLQMAYATTSAHERNWLLTEAQSLEQ